MPRFLFVYHGGSKPETQEEGERVMAAWGSWMSGLGENLVEGGNPVGMSMTVSSSGIIDGGGANPASGYSIVSADTIESACEMAKGCPILDTGSVEVAEIMEM